jgi:hypothetical protein
VTDIEIAELLGTINRLTHERDLARSCAAKLWDELVVAENIIHNVVNVPLWGDAS